MKNVQQAVLNVSLMNAIFGIAQGLTLKASCKLAGVSYSTLAWWMSKDKQAKQSNIKNKYTDVLERINHATHAEKIKHRKSFFLI